MPAPVQISYSRRRKHAQQDYVADLGRGTGTAFSGEARCPVPSHGADDTLRTRGTGNGGGFLGGPSGGRAARFQCRSGQVNRTGGSARSNGTSLVLREWERPRALLPRLD